MSSSESNAGGQQGRDGEDWPGAASPEYVGRLVSRFGARNSRDDLVQEVLLAFHRSRPVQNEVGWLHAVARNLTWRHRRSEERRRRHEEEFARGRHLHPRDDEDHRRESLERLADAMAQLPAAYREPLSLRYLEQLGLQEIATRLGTPVGTIQTRLKRGLERLRAKLPRDRALFAILFVEPPELPAPPSRSHLESHLQLVAAMLIGFATVCTLLTLPYSPSIEVQRSGSIDAAVTPHVFADESVSSGSAAVRESAATTDQPAPVGPPTQPDLTLKIRRSDGTPATGVNLGLLHSGLPSMNAAMPWHRTDGSGNVVLRSVASGTYRVVLDRSGFARELIIDPRSQPVVELILPAAYEVRGTVFDAHGCPMPGAEIHLHPNMQHTVAGNLVATTDALGNFRVTDLAPSAMLRASHPDFRSSSFFEVEAGQNLLIDGAMLKLGTPGPHHLTGQVLGLPRGTRGLVTVVDQEMRLRNARLDEDLRFDVPGLDAGGVMVHIAGEGWYWRGRTDPATQQIVVDVRQMRRVEGEVVDENSKAMAGCLVTLGIQGDNLLCTTTDRNGRFAFDHAFDDCGYLTVFDSAGSRLHLQAQKELQHRPMPIRIVPVAPAIVRVVDAEGHPLPAVHCRTPWPSGPALLPGLASAMRKHTDSSGETALLVAEPIGTAGLFWATMSNGSTAAQLEELLLPGSLHRVVLPTPNHAVHVSARLVDAEGDPVEAAEIWWPKRRDLRLDWTGDSVSLLLQPGCEHVMRFLDRNGNGAEACFRGAPGERIDLGTLRLESVVHAKPNARSR
jgi:RNA polymerase sigma-70 factor (ECF subfamily)